MLSRISSRHNLLARKKVSTDASYFQRKAILKQQRIQSHMDRIKKLDERQKRRDGSPKEVMKLEFREWWDTRRSHEESLDRKARQVKKDWKMEVAVVLERLPVVLDDTTDLEKDFDELQAYLRQFGKDYPKELVPQRTMQALVTDEDLLAELPLNFRPAPRETEADHSGRLDTLDRKLKNRVFFLLEDDQGSWKFPESSVEDGESLQATAERILREQVGKELELYFPSSAPIAVQVKGEEEGAYFGTKKFFMRVQHDEGNVVKGIKHGWLDREEIVGSMEGDEDSIFYHYLL